MDSTFWNSSSLVISCLYSNCKSQLCSLFHERTCSRFTRLSSSPCPKYLINPYNAIFLKSQVYNNIKNDILDCQIHKYTNENTQIHKYKYTYTQIRLMASNTQNMLNFCTADDSRKSKNIFPSVHKYRETDTNASTNTHIYSL